MAKRHRAESSAEARGGRPALEDGRASRTLTCCVTQTMHAELKAEAKVREITLSDLVRERLGGESAGGARLPLEPYMVENRHGARFMVLADCTRDGQPMVEMVDSLGRVCMIDPWMLPAFNRV